MPGENTILAFYLSAILNKIETYCFYINNKRKFYLSAILNKIETNIV